MHVLGAICTIIGILGLGAGCFLSFKKMRTLQDYNLRQKNPTAYNKAKSSFTSYIVLGVGIFAFIIGFILLNFA